MQSLELEKERTLDALAHEKYAQIKTRIIKEREQERVKRFHENSRLFPKPIFYNEPWAVCCERCCHKPASYVCWNMSCYCVMH